MDKKQLHQIDCYIGQKLKFFRIFRGYTLEGLAAEIDLTFQQIQKYETGYNRLSASRIVQISYVLNIHPASFFEGVGGIKMLGHMPLPDVFDRDIFTILQESSEALEKTRQGLTFLIHTLKSR